MYFALRPRVCVQNVSTYSAVMQCEWGLRTTNEGGMSIQVTVLEIIIAVLHCLPGERRVGCDA